MGLLPGHLFASIFEWNYSQLELSKQGFRKEAKKPCFRKNRSLVIRGSIFGVLLDFAGPRALVGRAERKEFYSKH